MNTAIQSLWIGGALSRVERLCISSFLSQGHEFHLYTYGNVDGIPDGATVLNGEEILSSEYIFLNSDRKTYSGFSNLFRYKLLRDKGGVWTDLDVVCLRPFKFGEDTIIAQEIDEDGSVIVATCVIASQANSTLMKECFEGAAEADRSKQKFGTLGPYFFARFVQQHADQVRKMSPSVFCPVPYRSWSDLISEQPDRQAFVSKAVGEETLSVHLWNEMWRLAGIDKNARFASDSFFERACSKLGL
jgi:Glycosyltransferase sugar-binding region containing DXD motif/Alpha 1,4-glycosyltransferase conserved region